MRIYMLTRIPQFLKQHENPQIRKSVKVSINVPINIFENACICSGKIPSKSREQSQLHFDNFLEIPWVVQQRRFREIYVLYKTRNLGNDRPIMWMHFE